MPEVTLRAVGRPIFRHAGQTFDALFRVYKLTDKQLKLIEPYIGRFLQRKPGDDQPRVESGRSRRRLQQTGVASRGPA